MPLGMVVIDRQLNVIRMNQMAESVLEVSAMEVLGSNIDHVLKSRPEMRVLQLTVEMQVEFSNYEVKIEKGANPIWLLVNTKLMRGEDDGVIGATMIFSDITAVKLMDEQTVRVARLATIGELAAGAAHEIRNPLTVIKGFLQLMSAERREHPYLPLILQEIERIDRLVKHFLQLSKQKRVEESGLELFNLAELMESLYNLCRSEAILKSVELSLEMCEEKLPVLLNETEWKQIVLNLFRNSLDAFYEEQRDRRVHVAVRKRPHHATLFLADNGCGIPQDVLRQVRTAFFTTKREGTGLGLAICDHLVARNGCRFRLYSRQSVGTVVVLQVPLVGESAAVDALDEVVMG
jgi:two-component system, sporulation sensor kinase E